LAAAMFVGDRTTASTSLAGAAAVVCTKVDGASSSKGFLVLHVCRTGCGERPAVVLRTAAILAVSVWTQTATLIFTGNVR